MNVSDIDAQIAELTKQRVKAVKDEKKIALSEVKKLITDYRITSGDLRGVLVKKYDKNGKAVIKAKLAD